MADSSAIPGPSATPSAPSAYGAAPSAASQHLIYVLLDSNLPTGGFVASGGLESYAKHGFLHPPAAAPFAVQTGAVGIETPALVLATNAAEANGAPPAQPRARPMSAPAMGPGKAGPAVVAFARAEMENFERSTGAYLSGAWGAVDAALCAPSKAWSADDDVPGAAASPSVASPAPSPSPSVDSTVAALVALDTAHEATLLSHVPRRASRAQGVALLTLHARGMGAPPGFPLDDEADEDEDEESDGAEPESESESEFEGESEGQVRAETRSGAGVEGRGSGRGRVGEGEGHKAATARRNELARELVAAYRHAIRRGAPGHLAVCFGVVTACLGLDLGE
jgi:urease accessory protein